MRRLSIARSLQVALLGLTVALAVIAALGVAGLTNARQRYEDKLAATYQLEASAADLLASGVIEESALTQPGPGAAQARREAAATFGRGLTQARRLAGDDQVSTRLLSRQATAEAQARRLAAIGAPVARVSAQLAEVRRAGGALTDRQRARRAQARDRERSDSRRALITIAAAGILALVAALGLVAALIGTMRRPLDELVRASRGLAEGDLERRVEPGGPVELRDLGEAFNSMGHDLERAREAIELERRRLAVTIESLGDALVVCDATGEITSLNPRAADLVPELEPGMRADDEEGPLPPLEQALSGEVTVERGGRTLAVTAALLGGPTEGVVWTVRDVTERARLERLKSEFVATVSHELRSPLTSIKGFVELLARGEDLTERDREFLNIILLSTNRLVDLVNDLLDVARIEAGEVEVHRRTIDVSEAVSEVATLLGPRIADKGQELVVSVPPALPPALADPSRVRQILTNLLTNAHLYTPEGGRLAVTVSAQDDWLLLEVADTGRGMTPEELERVWERFYRGTEGASTPGTGLGLSIVRSLVDLHGGSIDVRSTLGEGTSFTVRLPQAPTPERGNAARLALHGKRVLIVDDEPEIGQLIATHLRPFDVETVLVHTGEEALERLREERFDAVTLDILMPGTSGFEVLQAIRADPEMRRTPLVVVSVFSGREALAGEMVVAKPIDADELVDALGSAVIAGRTRVLVVGRDEMRERLVPALERLGIEHDWAGTGAEAARLCEERRFEVALVDAGLRSPQAILEALDLRGRRVRRAVVVFSTDDEAPGLARLGAQPVRVEDAAAAVLEAIGEPVELPAGVEED